MLKNLIKNNNIIQFIKFGLVGLSNTLLALLVYYVLVFFNINYMLANFFAWVISVYNAYYWNNRYVFQGNTSKVITIIQTYTSYGLSFVLSSIILYILVEIGKISTALAPLFTLAVTIPINFLLNKYWAFR